MIQSEFADISVGVCIQRSPDKERFYGGILFYECFDYLRLEISEN